jgi:hypothetical protein
VWALLRSWRLRRGAVLHRRPGGRKEGEESVPLDEVGADTIRLGIAFRRIDRAPLDLDWSTLVRSGIIKSEP